MKKKTFFWFLAAIILAGATGFLGYKLGSASEAPYPISTAPTKHADKLWKLASKTTCTCDIETKSNDRVVPKPEDFYLTATVSSEQGEYEIGTCSFASDAYGVSKVYEEGSSKFLGTFTRIFRNRIEMFLSNFFRGESIGAICRSTINQTSARCARCHCQRKK